MRKPLYRRRHKRVDSNIREIGVKLLNEMGSKRWNDLQEELYRKQGLTVSNRDCKKIVRFYNTDKET